MKPISSLTDITPQQFINEIVPQRQPVVFKGLVEHWPAVQLRNSSVQFSQYLREIDSGQPCYTIVGPPDVNGRLFYGTDLKGVNFAKTNASIGSALDHIAAQNEAPKPHAIAVQAAKVKDAMPRFAQTHTFSLLSEVEPTFWLSNQSIVAPHFDLFDNIACVVHGRRQFTLFPPEQISNLYIGPTLDAPGGVPISTVDTRNPDLDQHPRYAQALENAQSAVLEAGDALYIPSPWWHGVESKDPLNLLVNYWWSSTGEPYLPANKSLLHAMLSIGRLPKPERLAWRSFFDYLVFKVDHDPTEHLPHNLHDVVTELTEEQLATVLNHLNTLQPKTKT